MLWIKLVDSELLPFLCRYSKINKYNKWIGFWRWKLSKSGAVVRTLASLPPGRGVTVLPIMAFMGRLRLKGVLFSCFRYMKWYEFVVGSLPLREVFLWVLRSIFPSLQKPTFPNSNSIQNTRTLISFQQLLSAPWENTKYKITNYQFTCLFFLDWYLGYARINVAVWRENVILNLFDIGNADFFVKEKINN